MTTYCFVRGSQYSYAEFLADLDPDGLLSHERYNDLVDAYKRRVDDLIEEYDPTLTWLPYISEVYGIVDQTESSPIDFAEWWDSGADGQFETALIDAWEEIESRESRVYGNEKTSLVLTGKAAAMYSKCDPLTITELWSGKYSVRGVEEADDLTAEEVNEMLEDLADELAEMDEQSEKGE